MENNNLAIIKEAWLKELAKFNESEAIRRVMLGQITVEHYKSYLREVYFHTRENPQLQTFAAVFFKGKQRQYVKKFFSHASSEIGHDQLALNDIVTLGGDISNIPYERPLPETTALLAFGFYQIQFLNPIGYLGYLFHLEFTPTQQGGAYMQALERIGVPKEAMTFIHDHSTIDVGHNKMMEGYAADLILNEEDLESVIYAIRVTANLYAKMIEAALRRVDQGGAYDYGLNTSEMTTQVYLN